MKPMGCANSKAADQPSKQPPSTLQFDAAALDDMDASTHKKKSKVVVDANGQAVKPEAKSTNA